MKREGKAKKNYSGGYSGRDKKSRWRWEIGERYVEDRLASGGRGGVIAQVKPEGNWQGGGVEELKGRGKRRTAQY